MNDDKIKVTSEEITYIISQLVNAQVQVQGLLSKNNVILNTIESDAKSSAGIQFYHGKASEDLVTYFTQMRNHLSQLDDFLSLGIFFLVNTLASTSELDEAIKTSMQGSK